MKERIYLHFASGRDSWNRVQDLFRAIGKENLLPEKSSVIDNYGFYFYSDDKALQLLIDKLKKLEKSEGWRWGRRVERIYTQKELESCKLLAFSINRAPKGHGGPTYGTKYDLSSACKACGTGAIQRSSLILKSAEIPKNKDIVQTLDDEIIVSSRIKSLLSKFRGLELRQVEFSNRTTPSLYQLIPKTQLPKMSDTSKGMVRQNQCSLCNRDGYFHTTKIPFEPHYDNLAEGLLNKSDIFSTYEHFGISRIRENFSDSHLAQPLILVKPTVMNALNDLKIKGLRFEPVVVNGYPDIESWREKDSFKT